MSYTRIPSWNSFTHDTRVEIFLEVIISGGFNILRDAEVIQAALDAKGSRMNLPLPMKTARDLGVKAGFSELFTCRYNYVDQQACELILERRFQEPRGTRGSNPVEEAYLENAQRAQEESCNFLEHFIGRVILKLDEKIGTGFLTCCKRNERQSIYGAIFDNYPVYFLKLLHCKEAHVVDFATIFASDSPDRIKWQRFFRAKFIDMVDYAFVYQGYRPALEFLWQNWTGEDKVSGWDGIDQYDLPCIPDAKGWEPSSKVFFDYVWDEKFGGSPFNRFHS